MRKWLNKYFDFTKREFNGLLVLVALLILLLAFPYLYKMVYPAENNPVDEQKAIQKLALLLADKSTANYSARNENVEHYKYKSKAVLFKFDPNTIDEKGWQKLGLSLKQAQSILKYRRKGGQFRETEDLQKMYTLSPQMYKRLAPYVEIKDTEEKGNHPYKTDNYPSRPVYQRHTRSAVEINSSDTLQLEKIKGIGPAFARRIVKYRERLGGFYKKEQLMEVFGLDSVKYKEIKDQVSIDITAIKKININTALFEDFKNHPYLRYKQVIAIIAYRKQHGNYADIADLKKVAVLSPETVENLTPYISFNHD